jgi:hypothetical protein
MLERWIIAEKNGMKQWEGLKKIDSIRNRWSEKDGVNSVARGQRGMFQAKELRGATLGHMWGQQLPVWCVTSQAGRGCMGEVKLPTYRGPCRS